MYFKLENLVKGDENHATNKKRTKISKTSQERTNKKFCSWSIVNRFVFSRNNLYVYEIERMINLKKQENSLVRFKKREKVVGKVVKIFKYSDSKFKYKVRIAKNTYLYCKEKELVWI